MMLIFIMLMSSFFVMVEHEKATFHLDDIYLFKKNETSNVWPFIILVVCSWIGPYSDTATKTLRYVSLWKEYFEELSTKVGGVYTANELMSKITNLKGVRYVKSLTPSGIQEASMLSRFVLGTVDVIVVDNTKVSIMD